MGARKLGRYFRNFQHLSYGALGSNLVGDQAPVPSLGLNYWM